MAESRHFRRIGSKVDEDRYDSTLPDRCYLIIGRSLSNPVTTNLFTQYYGIHYLPPQSYQPSYLADLIQTHGPLQVNTLWDASGYTRRLPTGLYHGSSGHFRIFAGIRGDGTAEGTTIRVYDPWAPTVGAIYSISYKKLLGETLTLTYQLWYR